MQHVERKHTRVKGFVASACLLSVVLVMFWVTGCGGNQAPSNPPSDGTQGAQKYFAPYVIGTKNQQVFNDIVGPETYSFDDFLKTFAQTSYALVPPEQEGPQIINAGTWTASSNGLLNLSTTVNYAVVGNSQYVAVPFTPPQTGSFAVELTDQSGVFVQLKDQPATPATPALQCPSLAIPTTYEYITIPGSLLTPGTAPEVATWDPTTDTAYGSIDIQTSGNMVTFTNPHQFTLPSVGLTVMPANPAAPSTTGACGPTFFGNVTNFPFPQIVQNPGHIGNSQLTTPDATLGIGPTGLLVEDNGYQLFSIINADNPVAYANTLGAGTGAIGMPKPSGQVDAGAIGSAQYLGFVVGTGVWLNTGSTTGKSSHLASFGSSSVPSTCPWTPAGTDTIIYGGDFTNEDPTTPPNSNLAIDLGAQDPTYNGIFPGAKVCLGGNYATNTTGQAYTFPAVALAGQLNGQNVIFLVGSDSTEPWVIYLLQSK